MLHSHNYYSAVDSYCTQTPLPNWRWWHWKLRVHSGLRTSTSKSVRVGGTTILKWRSDHIIISVPMSDILPSCTRWGNRTSIFSTSWIWVLQARSKFSCSLCRVGNFAGRLELAAINSELEFSVKLSRGNVRGYRRFLNRHKNLTWFHFLL